MNRSQIANITKRVARPWLLRNATNSIASASTVAGMDA
jgi:hypothetical protein